jgi:hypothetical protein
VYDPENKDCIIFFNTWDELKKLIYGEIPIDKEKLRANMKRRNEEKLVKTYKQWGELIESIRLA